MSRRENDYYPTPPCASYGLRAWLNRNVGVEGAWQDPAAGYGRLLVDMVDVPALRFAMDVDPRHQSSLAEYCDTVVIGNAFEVPWNAACHIVMNPPFNELEGFHRRGHDHARGHDRVVCMLTRTGYWQAAARNVLPRPDHLLLMTWRPSFDGTGQTDSYSYCWAVWDGAIADDELKTRCQVSWIERPPVPAEAVVWHRVLAAHAGATFEPAQGALL